jgi:hypothetical protein
MLGFAVGLMVVGWPISFLLGVWVVRRTAFKIASNGPGLRYGETLTSTRPGQPVELERV